MENYGDPQSEPIIHEMTDALAREMDFYRELKRRRMIFSIWKPKAELTPEQEMAFQRSTCDPQLKAVARTVLEEVQYNRNERRMAYRVLFIILGIAVIAMVTIPLIITWAVKGSGKHTKKYLSSHS